MKCVDMVRRGALVVLMTTAAVSCRYSPAPKSGALKCGDDATKRCPSGYSCGDNGRCLRDVETSPPRTGGQGGHGGSGAGGVGAMTGNVGGSAGGGGSVDGAAGMTGGSGGVATGGMGGSGAATDAPAVDGAAIDAPGTEGRAADMPPPGPEALPRRDIAPFDVTRVEAGTPAVNMSFFITSTGSGAMGGNLGGLPGADTKCQTLAAAVGMGHKTWRAYLSTSAGMGAPVNARDRIGTGPWHNHAGVQIAANLTELHGVAPFLNLETALDERGMRVPGRGTPMAEGGSQHDILTGATLDGLAMPPMPDVTCSNWTNAAARSDGGVVPAAQVGHFDRVGAGTNPQSWNSAHATPACDQSALASVGGAGRFYCFATN